MCSLLRSIDFLSSVKRCYHLPHTLKLPLASTIYLEGLTLKNSNQNVFKRSSHFSRSDDIKDDVDPLLENDDFEPKDDTQEFMLNLHLADLSSRSSAQAWHTAVKADSAETSNEKNSAADSRRAPSVACVISNATDDLQDARQDENKEAMDNYVFAYKYALHQYKTNSSIGRTETTLPVGSITDMLKDDHMYRSGDGMYKPRDGSDSDDSDSEDDGTIASFHQKRLKQIEKGNNILKTAAVLTDRESRMLQRRDSEELKYGKHDSLHAHIIGIRNSDDADSVNLSEADQIALRDVEVSGTILGRKEDSLLTRLALAERQWNYIKKELNEQQASALQKPENHVRYTKGFRHDGYEEHIYKHSARWKQQRLLNNQYKAFRNSRYGRMSSASSEPRRRTFLNHINADNMYSVVRVLDVDSVDLRELHHTFMYTLVKKLPAEICMKIIGRIALFRDNQKQISYERMIGDCCGGGGSRGTHGGGGPAAFGGADNKRYNTLLAEHGGELLGMMCRCYQTIGVPFMVDYVRRYGQFSRQYIVDLINKSSKPKLFDFVRYSHKGGVRELPGIIVRPWALESYIKLLPRCSGKNFMYQQLILRGLIAGKLKESSSDPTTYSDDFDEAVSSHLRTGLISKGEVPAGLRLSVDAEEHLLEKWRSLNSGDSARGGSIVHSIIRPRAIDAFMASEHTGKPLEEFVLPNISSAGSAKRILPSFFSSESAGPLNSKTLSMQLTKVAPNIPIALPPPSSPKPDPKSEALLDPADIHPRTYWSREQVSERFSPRWWSNKWGPCRTFFRFKGKAYAIKGNRTQSVSDNSVPRQTEDGWCEVTDESGPMYGPIRRRPRHRDVRRRQRQRRAALDSAIGMLSK